MLVYWEDELINKTRKDNKLIFVENLKMFVENNKDEIEFAEVRAKSNDIEVIYQEATTKDGTIYRQVDPIRTKEDLLDWYERFSYGKLRWSYLYMRNNIPFLSYRYIGGCLGDMVKPPYKELCYDDEDLFRGFSNTYFNGYSFNVADPKKVYKDVYIYDFKSNHSAIMCQEKFPKRFMRIDERHFERIYKKNLHFYGEFRIKVNINDVFFHKFGQLYNEEVQIFHGYFNDIDFEFIDRLGDIEDVICYKLWIVELDYLPQNLRTAIQAVFNWKEEEDKKDENIRDKKVKTIYKYFLEKLYGECVRRRFYKTSYKWDTEQRTMVKINNEYNWEEIQKNLFHHYDYSWGVWICSYARLKLLKIRQKLGAAALYGDIDSIFFTGDNNLKYIMEVNSHGETLGKLALEGYANQIKFLDQKWYCYEGLNKNGNPTFVVKSSGADPEKIKSYLLTCENPVESFSKQFPTGVNPYKRIRKNADGKLEYYWSGGVMEDNTITDDKKVIISCAGSGKTTTLVNEVIKKFKETDDRIIVIAFTNKNVDELRQRIGIYSERLEIRTLDSLASSLLYGAISGELHEIKLDAATTLLQEHPDVMLPSHLFVDEFQDLDPLKFNFICSIPSISRFYIGDPNQSIYGYNGAMNDLFNRLINFKVEYRSINYRCTQNINDYAEGFLSEKNRPFATSNLDNAGEIDWSMEIPDDDSIILCRTNREVDFISQKYPNRQVMTIHKSKGLTFDSVCVVGINKTMDNEEEQNIAYVACTRAKEKITIIIGGIE